MSRSTASRSFSTLRGLIWAWTLGPLVLAAPGSAAVFAVNSIGDAGDLNAGDGTCWTGGFVSGAVGLVAECSLRAAIEQANADSTLDEIRFAAMLPADAAGTAVLQPSAPLPAIEQPVLLLGDTAPGYDDADPLADPIVVVLGHRAGSGADGLVLTEDADGSLLRAIAVVGFDGHGVRLQGADDVQVDGCAIGIYRGTVVSSNAGHGIWVNSGSRRAWIGALWNGAAFVGRGNLVSGNAGDGVRAYGPESRLAGNRIGTDRAGLSVDGPRVPSTGNGGWGVRIGNLADDAEVGVTRVLLDGVQKRLNSGNTIAGNARGGVLLTDGVAGTHIMANRIGTDRDGGIALANGDGPGVFVEWAHEVRIGQTNGSFIFGGSAGNLISGHREAGLVLGALDRPRSIDIGVRDNAIGTDASRTAPLGNVSDGVRIVNAQVRVRHNAIGANLGDGIRILSSESRAADNQIGRINGEDLGNQGAGVSIRGKDNKIGGEGGTVPPGLVRLEDGNLIAANGSGIVIEPGSTGNALVGNEILDNVRDGVLLDESRSSTVGYAARDTVLSGRPAGNRIAGNGGAGVRIVGSSAALGNAVRGNTIGDNAALAIDLGREGSDGVDPGDADEGANRLINAPLLDPASVAWNSDLGRVEVAFRLETDAAAARYPIVVDFYREPASSGQALYLGSTLVTAPTGLRWSLVDLDPAGSVEADDALVATATDDDGSTSEWSERIPLPEPGIGLASWLGASFLFTRRTGIGAARA